MRRAQSKSLLDSCSIALPQNCCDVLGLAIIKKRGDSKSINRCTQALSREKEVNNFYRDDSDD